MDRRSIKFYIRRCGGTGRHKGLKIPRSKIRTGSIPVSGTISTPKRECFFITGIEPISIP